VLFGKQQRQYDADDPADLGSNVLGVPNWGDLLLGVKGGMDYRLGDSNWLFRPALGFAGNLDHGSRSSLFGDTELGYRFRNGASLASGVTFWDFTHGAQFTAGWLGSAAFPVWKSEAKKHQTDLTFEWRQFFDRGSDPDTNYQFWGGMRYVFK
jgi:hypothetical protein